MQKIKIKESPLFWPAKLVGSGRDRSLLVLDETLLPGELKYIKIRNTQEAVEVIRQMKTRAFGQFLVVLNTFLMEIHRTRHAVSMRQLQNIADALNNSRPTFPFSEVTGPVLHWAQKAMEEKKDVSLTVAKNIEGYLRGIRIRRLERVQKIADLIKEGDSILTHCNVSGELAMAAYICRQQNKDIHFFATETRPFLQGAKLTCWELKKMGASVTLIADNAVASVMADGLVNKVIVGSDRSCANGDFANKIGTYQIAVLAQEFGIPFYALTQPSARIKEGKDIPIEIRNDKELLNYSGKRIVEGNVRGFYPGFDVVPHEFIKESIAINVGSTRPAVGGTCSPLSNVEPILSPSTGSGSRKSRAKSRDKGRTK